VTVRCPRRSLTIQDRPGWTTVAGVVIVVDLDADLVTGEAARRAASGRAVDGRPADLPGSADDGVGTAGTGAGERDGRRSRQLRVVVLQAADQRPLGGEDLVALGEGVGVAVVESAQVGEQVGDLVDDTHLVAPAPGRLLGR
jgi:hypothetical protein